ncbi:MAG: hypothetical protein NTW25_09890 [Candidatus Kapabacteria bacterium]|nr:hypothetical protein [Candidatus Kapabacteria bacterium]
MANTIPNNNNKVWLNKLNLYSQDLFLYKQRLNEASKSKTNVDIISDAIKLERTINDFIKQNENIKNKIKHFPSNKDYILDDSSENEDFSPIIEKLDSEYNDLRKIMLSFLAKIID